MGAFRFRAAFAFASESARAASIVPSSSTDSWRSVGYPTLVPDHSDDRQTGQHDSDIVGKASIPALYAAYEKGSTSSKTEGAPAFRVRLGTSQKGGEHVFLIGLDAGIDGAIDLFLGVNNARVRQRWGSGAPVRD